MEKTQLKLKSNGVLTRYNQYLLQHDGKNVRIDVHQVIAGEYPGFLSGPGFLAVPVDTFGLATKNKELHIRADTEHSAVEALLEAVYSLSWEEIYPKA